MSSWHDIGEAPPYAAASDLSAKQFYIVKLGTSAQTYALAAAGTDKNIMGVLQNKPTAGQACLVFNRGKIPVIYNDTITIGDRLTADSGGKAVKTTTGGDTVIGVATKSGVAGDIGEMEAPAAPLY